MLKDILISMIIWVVVGCGNGSGVKRLDTRAVEKDTVLKWSQLVGESRLVRLETKEEALLNDYFRVWAGEKYIITYGNEEMYQFAADGTYIRKLASYGRAPGEYQNIIALTVDEPGERLYFSDYGRQNSIQVINLKNGEYENSLPGIYGFPKKMILAGDSVLYCIPLLLKDAAYEIYALTSSGQFLGGIKKRDLSGGASEESFLSGDSGRICSLYVRDNGYFVSDNCRYKKTRILFSCRILFERIQA